jgi:GT2 family glycosyltransferase
MQHPGTSVSVIIPTYNRAAFLPKAVHSVLAQSHVPAEVIVVDDGSTDETETVCRTFPAPVRYLRQRNSGQAAARNLGLSEARSDWVAFLDSDDIWNPTKLAVQLAALREVPEAGWSTTGCVVVDRSGEPVNGTQSLERVFAVFRNGRLTAEDFLSRALERRRMELDGGYHTLFAGDAFELMFHGNFALTSTALIRRDLALRIGGFDPSLRVSEDTEYFHRLAAVSPVVLVMTPLVRWVIGHEPRITAPGNWTRLIEEAIVSVDRALGLRQPPTPRVLQTHREGKRALLLRLAYSHLSELDTAAARQSLREVRRLKLGLTPRWLGLWAATLFPRWLLRTLPTVKRTLGQ